MGEAKPQAGQPDSNKTEGSSISKGEQSLSHLKENEIVETEKGEAIVSHGQARYILKLVQSGWYYSLLSPA